MPAIRSTADIISAITVSPCQSMPLQLFGYFVRMRGGKRNTSFSSESDGDIPPSTMHAVNPIAALFFDCSINFQLWKYDPPHSLEIWKLARDPIRKLTKFPLRTAAPDWAPNSGSEQLQHPPYSSGNNSHRRTILLIPATLSR